MRQSEEARVHVGTVLDNGAVDVKVATHRNGTQTSTYHYPETMMEVAAEDIVWSREVLAFRKRFETISEPADKLDQRMTLAYMICVKYGRLSASSPEEDAQSYS